MNSGHDIPAMYRSEIKPRERQQLLDMAEEASAGEEILFHVTWKGRVASVQRTGLTPGGTSGRANNWTGGEETRARCRGRIFLTTRERVSHWIERMEENLEPPTPGATLVVLCVSVAGYGVEPDWEYPGDFIVTRKIPPSRIRVARKSDRTSRESRTARALLRAALVEQSCERTGAIVSPDDRQNNMPQADAPRKASARPRPRR